jgi:hypothetical protein
MPKSTQRNSFRSGDVKRKRSIVMPSDSLDSFSQEMRSSDVVQSFDHEKSDNSDSGEEGIASEAAKARRLSSAAAAGPLKKEEYEKLMLSTLIQLRQSSEHALLCSQSTLNILDNAITAMQLGDSHSELPSGDVAVESSQSCLTSSWWPWVYVVQRFERSSLMSLLAGTNLLIG